MDTETSLIIASTRQLPAFEFNVSAKEAKEVALRNAALIAKVSDRDSKIIAVRAQQGLKKVISDIEKARKELKEPLLNAGRQLDNLCARETLELDKEFGRVSNAVKEFDDAERRRVLEEERLQRLELERIEAEKQAELKRIADEQAAREVEAKRIQGDIDRKAREAAEAAAKMAREATNKKQREAAEVARQDALKGQAQAEVERQKQAALLAEQAKTAAAQTVAIEEKAGDAAYCAAKPIAITTVAGSRQSTNWKITVDQPFVLARHRPDLVNITPRLAEIKAALNNGETIQGITAVRETTSGVRLPPERKVIEV
jgi:hypothetical protein